MKSVLLISHGSQLAVTEEEIRALLGILKDKSDIPIFEYAFLEIASPSIPEGIDLCVQRGASQIIILLNFLNSGKHVDEDIPKIISEAREKYPQVKFHITKPIGQHDLISRLFLNMIEKSDSK